MVPRHQVRIAVHKNSPSTALGLFELGRPSADFCLKSGCHGTHHANHVEQRTRSFTASFPPEIGSPVCRAQIPCDNHAACVPHTSSVLPPTSLRDDQVRTTYHKTAGQGNECSPRESDASPPPQPPPRVQSAPDRRVTFPTRTQEAH